jgi:2-oxoglutarate dehydrogenase E2 component (dihydrolipoamide succinyltransferase)
MTVEIKVPSVGESITEVRVGDWLKRVGDVVELDQPVVTIETDKVTVDVLAPATGVLASVLVETGADASVGQVIGTVAEGAATAATTGTGGAEERGAAKAVPGGAPEPAGTSAPSGSTPEGAELAPAAAAAPLHARVMPSARRALRERGLDPSQVVPTGPGGRLLKEDVLRHDLQPSGASPRRAEGAPPPVSTTPVAERGEEVVPMTPMRRRIAERLVAAQQGAALLTTFNEVDLSAVIELRRTHQESFQARHGVKLGFMSFFVKAVVEGLRLVPQVNAEIRGTDVVYRSYFDIGVAVGGGRGLVVPVLRDAGRLGFAEIERRIADLARRAQENRLELSELQGGTFTISNGGIYGSMLSTPIVNPPQSGILGMHAIQDRPVAREGQVVIRPMMYVALTYDHRIVDGREAVTFLRRVKECVEEPTRMLLEV